MRSNESTNQPLPRVLFWSASYDVENGQAIVTRRVVEQQTEIQWIKVIYAPGRGVATIKAFLSAIDAFFRVLIARPDTIYAVCSRSTAGFLRDLPVLFTSLLGFRLLVHVHGSDLPDLLQRSFVGALARSLYRRCELLVPSSHLIPILQSLGCKRATLCENFIAEPVGPAAAPEFGNGPVKLLWNSNLMASKGFVESVEGARLAHAKGVDLSLTILGRPIGDLEAKEREIADFVESISNESWINVVGPVSAEEAREAVYAHDVILLPSRYPSECQPLAVIEAMAAAREVVITNTPALRSTVGSYPANVVAGDAKSVGSVIEAVGMSSPMRAHQLEAGAAEARVRFARYRFDREISKALLSEAS